MTRAVQDQSLGASGIFIVRQGHALPSLGEEAFDSLAKAYAKLGSIRQRLTMAANHRFIISDYPTTFLDSTVVTVYPEGGDPLADAVASLTIR